MVNIGAGDLGGDEARLDLEVVDVAVAQVAPAAWEAGFMVVVGLEMMAPCLRPKPRHEFRAFFREGQRDPWLA